MENDAKRVTPRQITEALMRELALLAEGDRTVLSVYLDLSQGWDRATGFVARESSRLERLVSGEEREYLEASVSFLADFLKRKKMHGFAGPGLAFFADLGADYVRGVELPAPPEPLLAVDSGAVLFPLAVQLDEYEPVGVILVDASGARILVTAGETAEAEDSLREKIHHRSKVGGWSQMRYQRRREKQVKHLAKELADRAEEIFREEGINRVVLAGHARMIAALKEELPPSLVEKVIGEIPWNLKEGDSELLEKMEPLVEAVEREQEKSLLEHLTAGLRRGGLAVAGVEDAELALQMGAVDVLLIGDGIAADARERLTDLAESTDAHVEYVPGKSETLDGLDGVGALLRFKVRR
ncbi:MAG TPA: Vms1/Ankzf1 family peptidyl-tRNA hydrolase [bacterium]|nr:Vms1/Ankzf1 family peptidyl-tRNA hydrolase [bacterium]